MLLAVSVSVALTFTSPGAPSATDCGTVPPKTVSPTNSRLWTADHGGKWVAALDFVNSDGSMWLKAPWFAAGPRGRPKRGPRGELRITGKRLDGVAAPLGARTRQVWVDGYGGSGVWAVVLTFATEGCWSVTGRVERTIHSFRLLVTKAS